MKSRGKREPKTRARATPVRYGGLTAEERAAIRQRTGELRAAARQLGHGSLADGERDVLAAIAGMSQPYRAMGERLHAIIRDSAPQLAPRTWYGMPAYAKDGTVVCFFRSGEKFKERYMTLGFNDEAKLDEGQMWPVAFALTRLSASDEERVRVLVKKAVA